MSSLPQSSFVSFAALTCSEMYLEMNDLSVSATIGDPKVVLPCIGHDLQPIRHAVMWHKVSVLTGEDVSVSNNGK